METRRLFDNRFVSIFSLMRDGRQLAECLNEARHCRALEDGLKSITGLITPYLQFVTEEDICAHTGHRLVDIWRYFRHTWANPYKSVPGRSMMVLVRDAAVPYHPIIGIGGLSSAAVAVRVRDERIGWTVDRCLAEINERPSTALTKWLLRIVDEAIAELYKIDFLQEKILALEDLKRPTVEILTALEEEAREQRGKHHNLMEAGDYKKAFSAQKLGEEHWETQAQYPLFRSKRALALAQLLRVRMIFQRHLGKFPTKERLKKLAHVREGREAISRVVRQAKADRVGTAIADVSICGAIPPYNEILGGKLVALLLASPEVVSEYRRRYSKIPSVIASSMAGRPITRPADLAFLGTTSLYDQRPCQYDRIFFPGNSDKSRAADGIRYEYLGRTEGMGTFQFAKERLLPLPRFLLNPKEANTSTAYLGRG